MSEDIADTIVEKEDVEDDDMDLQDEFQPEPAVPDKNDNTKDNLLKSEENVADKPDKAEGKVIHISTKTDVTKPSISGLSSPVKLSQSPDTVTPVISNNTVFMCPESTCKLKLPSRGSLLTHIKMCHIHPSKDVKTEEESDFIPIKHKGGVTKVKIHECSICAYIAKNRMDLKKHLRTEHVEEKKHKCGKEGCDVKVTRKDHLVRHQRAVHEQEKFWHCDSCDYKTNNHLSFKKHKAQKHNGGDCDLRYSVDYLQNLPPNVNEESLNCICTWCPYKSNKYSFVKKHIEIYHEKTNQYPCKECSFVGENMDDYAKHYNEFHITDTYAHACTDCSFRCTNKADLKTHYLQEHSKQKLYVCKSCSYKTPEIYAMKRHISSCHSPVYKCEYCDYEADTREEVENHQYSDHGLHIADINSDDMKVVIINDDEHTIYSPA